MRWNRPVRRRAADRTGPARPASNPSTHHRGAKLGQIPPNPPNHGGFAPQGPLSDTNPAHPSKPTGAS